MAKPVQAMMATIDVRIRGKYNDIASTIIGEKRTSNGRQSDWNKIKVKMNET